MNPLTAIPPKARLYVYAVVTLAALCLSAYKATEGDWLEALSLVLGALVPATAATHTPAKILGKA